jgi:pimeloyl-ACP methyl ester carboxylesterase
MMRAVPAATMISALAAMRDRADHTATIAAAKVPILCIFGELDAITPPACADGVIVANTAAEKVTIAGAGHMSPLEAPGAVAAAIGAWLKKAGGR